MSCWVWTRPKLSVTRTRTGAVAIYIIELKARGRAVATQVSWRILVGVPPCTAHCGDVVLVNVRILLGVSMVVVVQALERPQGQSVFSYALF